MRVARKICFDNVETASVVIISGRNAHTRLWLSVRTESHSCQNGDVFKFPVFAILIESASSRVIGNINVRPPIVIEVGHQHSQPVGPRGCSDAAGFRDISESAVTVVVIKDIAAAFQTRRPASHHDALVEARSGFRHWSCFQIQINVVGNEQVQMTITIVVHEGASSIPAGAFPAYTGFIGNVSKSSVAVIVIKSVLAVVGNEKVFVTVIIVVADADSLSPSRSRQTCATSHISKGAISIVLI